MNQQINQKTKGNSRNKEQQQKYDQIVGDIKKQMIMETLINCPTLTKYINYSKWIHSQIHKA
jgi:hypothetical protein